MNALFHAISFLTRIPVPLRPNEADWKKSPMWYPFVGALVGLSLFLFDLLIAGWFPSLVRATLIVAFWVWITGGLHLDGLMDTADGLGSYRNRERILEIMKDSRVGAMGVLAGVLALLLKVSLIASQSTTSSWLWIVLTTTVLGRSAAVWVMVQFPYIQARGTGSGMKEELTVTRLGIAFFCMIIPIFLGYSWLGLILICLIGIVSWLFGWWVTKRLGGCTGDIYGAVIELTEIMVLLLLTIPEVNRIATNLAPTW